MRNLRNSNSISLPRNRLTSFKNSFFPATIRRWNKLPEEVRNETCNRYFRQAVGQIYALPKPPLYYSLGDKHNNTLHTRLRLGLSSLNAHLFTINSPQVDSPYCTCGPLAETAKHFFFLCPNFNHQRDELEKILTKIIVNYNNLTFKDKLTIVLCGRNLNTADGLAVATAVQKYIRNTKRFDR